jgi:hypothetical protein
MRRTILSTIGTSILTQQIDRVNTNEKDWYNLLRDSANLKQDSISPQVYKIILTLKERAMQQLKTVKIVSSQ